MTCQIDNVNKMFSLSMTIIYVFNISYVRRWKQQNSTFGKMEQEVIGGGAYWKMSDWEISSIKSCISNVSSALFVHTTLDYIATLSALRIVWVTLAGGWRSIIAVSDSDSPALMRSALGNLGPTHSAGQTSTKQSPFCRKPKLSKIWNFHNFAALPNSVLPQHSRHLVLIQHLASSTWCYFDDDAFTSFTHVMTAQTQRCPCQNIASFHRSLPSQMVMCPWQWGCNPQLSETSHCFHNLNPGVTLDFWRLL